LCADRALAERLGRAGKLRANDFRAERIAGEYEQLLDNLAYRIPPGPVPAPSLGNPATV
jgi:hypothetical protein